MLSDERIELRMAELRELSATYASAYATKSYLEEFKKSKIAILQKKYQQLGHKTTAAQEREARADPEYLELLDALRDATEQSETIRWQLKNAELGIEIWRTQESSKRAEKRGYGA